MFETDPVRKYQTILNDNGLGHKEVMEVISTKPDLIGEHLSSECSYVTLKLANGEPEVELFVKKNLPHIENMEHGSDQSYNYFDKEAEFFNVVLKDLQAYYMKNSGSAIPMDFFPKCFYADGKEVIMENLVKVHGYFLNPKELGQNLEYASMALENLAQLHAVSYSLMKEIGEETAMEKYKYAMREIMYIQSSPLLGIIENAKVVALELINNHDVPGSDRAIRILEKYGGEKLSENLIELVSPKSKNLCLVMTHGDFWNSNMMFLKNPVTGKLKHNIFIDFQVGRIGSPNLDLSYFIFACVRSEVRQQSLKALLELYYKKFYSMVELLTKSPFPHTFDEFVEDFKAKSLLGFWMNIIFAFLLEIMSTIDPSKVEGEFMPYFESHILKWIRANPERASKQAEKIVEICDEYEEFVDEASKHITTF